MKRGLQIAAACLVVLIGAFAVGSAVAGPFFWYSCSLDGLEAHGPSQASILLDRNGAHLGLLGASGNRQPVALRRISPVMRKAIVAVEDRRFYENNGIDYIGIVRALRSDVSTGGFAQGASTIEQQLVRNLYLTPQQTISRKLAEACLAVQLDKQWSKDRILAAYLNDIYFGQQAYGIEAAAHAYFGVHAKDLSLEQAALLAGLPQAPSGYDPLSRPDAAKARRAEVLRAMLQAGDISRARYRRAVHSPLGLHPRAAHGLASQSYLSDFITNQLVDQYGAERVRRGGLRIYTTLDGKMQTQATHSILGTLDRKGDPAGSVVSIDPKTGEIRAMAIAQTGKHISFDLPVDGRRQAGSTFKMLVLTQAVQRQINPYATQYLSAPFVGPDDWHVHTFENTYSGRIPLTQATLLSDNTVYARLALDLGPKPIAGLAHRMGIQSKLKAVPSIVLGVNAVSPLDLATAYATLADGGVAHDPTILTKVVFPDGHTEARCRAEGEAGRRPEGRGGGHARPRGERPVGDGNSRGAVGPACRREDGYDGQLRRRLVRGLGAAARHRHLGRLSDERAADARRARDRGRHRRHAAGTDLAHVHGRCPAGPAGRAVREPRISAVQPLVRALPVRAHMARRAEPRRLQAPAAQEEGKEDDHPAADHDRPHGDSDHHDAHDPHDHGATSTSSAPDDHHYADDYHRVDDDDRAAVTSPLRAGEARPSELPHRGRG